MTDREFLQTFVLKNLDLRSVPADRWDSALSTTISRGEEIISAIRHSTTKPLYSKPKPKSKP